MSIKTRSRWRWWYSWGDVFEAVLVAVALALLLAAVIA